MTTRYRLIALLLPGFALIACGDKTPVEGEDQPTDPAGDAGAEDGGVTDDPFASYANDFLPMGVGWYWEYKEIINGDEDDATFLTYEVTAEEDHVFQYHTPSSRRVFVLENTVDNEGKRRIQYIEDEGPPGGKAMRLRHEVYKVQEDADPTDTDTVVTEELTDTRDFVPGFLRFDRTKMLTSGETWLEPLTRHTETANQGYSKDLITYEFTILAIDATVTVGDRVYTNCIHFRRDNSDDTERKEYWHARGIGKVKEVSYDLTGGTKTEELVDCSRCN